ncbi:MAG: hypothetical protein J1E83_05420 [Lachnospiraceae bacterium]|nr:hypothetical protein [Lachnospiraceae bacterium]
MQNIRVTLFYGLITLTVAVLFFCTFLQVKAGYFVSSEAGFTHTHGNNCYKEVTTSCEYYHTMQRTTDSGIYYCTTCAKGTDHFVAADTYKCMLKGGSWQKNGSTTCKTCGTVHSRWDEPMPGIHVSTSKVLNCGIEEGESTAMLTISADDNWTNSGVMLTAGIYELKQDLTIGNINYSWEDGKLYVTENGTYSVTATDTLGRSISASIGIGCIDKTPPVIKSANGNTAEMSKTAIFVNIIAEDHESGLDAQAYSFDGGQSWSASSGILLEEGKDIQLAVRDKAGNIATGSLKRSAFPYPQEPSRTPPPSSSPVGSSSSDVSGVPADSTLSASSQASSSSQKTNSTSSGKISGSASNAADDREGARKSSQASGSNGSSGRGNTGTEENADVLIQEDLDQNENSADSNLFSGAGIFNMLMKMQAGRQKQEAVIPHAKRYTAVIKTTLASHKGNEADLQKQENDFFTEFILYIKTHLQSLIGSGLLVAGAGLLFRLIWLHSAVLYCYNGGEEYKRIGLLHLKRKKQEFELYLPEYMLETKGTPRYRLMFKGRLVKKHGGEDLVVHGEDYKLRQPLEECVDFVL